MKENPLHAESFEEWFSRSFVEVKLVH